MFGIEQFKSQRTSFMFDRLYLYTLRYNPFCRLHIQDCEKIIDGIYSVKELFDEAGYANNGDIVIFKSLKTTKVFKCL